MAAAPAMLQPVATVDAPLCPSQEADAAGIDGSPFPAIGHKCARPLVERRGLAHQSSVSDNVLS